MRVNRRRSIIVLSDYERCLHATERRPRRQCNEIVHPTRPVPWAELRWVPLQYARTLTSQHIMISIQTGMRGFTICAAGCMCRSTMRMSGKYCRFSCCASCTLSECPSMCYFARATCSEDQARALLGKGYGTISPLGYRRAQRSLQRACMSAHH